MNTAVLVVYAAPDADPIGILIDSVPALVHVYDERRFMPQIHRPNASKRTITVPDRLRTRWGLTRNGWYTHLQSPHSTRHHHIRQLKRQEDPTMSRHFDLP